MSMKSNPNLLLACMLLAVGLPVYLFFHFLTNGFNLSLVSADEVECVDLGMGDGVGVRGGETCYLTSEAARAGGVDPRDYCYDAAPAGDGKGWNAYNQEVCYFTDSKDQSQLEVGRSPQDYCYDTVPVGDGKGWNAHLEEVCYLAVDRAVQPIEIVSDPRDYCYDAEPVGDGKGWNDFMQSVCYFSDQITEPAPGSGKDPRDYCYDAAPVGDGKGWNAHDQEVCYLKVDENLRREIGSEVVEYCYDVAPAGDGIGIKNGDACYLTSEAALINGVDPRDYCYDTEPLADGKGWNAYLEEVCYFSFSEPPNDDRGDVRDEMVSAEDGHDRWSDSFVYCGSGGAQPGTWDDLDNYIPGARGRCLVYEYVDDDTETDPSEINEGSTSDLSGEREVAVPVGLRVVTSAPSQIVIGWDNSGVEGYNIERNGYYYDTVRDVASYVDQNVEENHIYTYKVSAFTGGVFSAGSDPLKVVARTPGVASVPPEGNPTLPAALRGEYSIAFFDEFNEGYLNPEKWNTSFLWGPDLTINNEMQYYVDINDTDFDLGISPFRFEGGSLVITASRTPDHLRGAVNNQPYTSGLITSYDAFKFTHGYAEARVKIPKGQGFWPAFWLLNAYYVEGQKKPEIDIMENLGHMTNRAYQTYHHFTPTGQLISRESHVDSVDYSEDYHIFSVEWKPNIIQFYIDGIAHNRIVGDSVANEPMYVLANLAVGGNWPGAPDVLTPFPSEYMIDWIRVYQKTE